MSDVNKIALKNNDFYSFSKEYIKNLTSIFNSISKSSLNKLEKDFRNIRKNKKTLFVFGNGGGASTATTMVNDLGFDVMKKAKINNTFKIICLNDNSSVMTAISNDTGYENIFLHQLKMQFKKGDSVLVFSASGNSPNLIKAVKWVKENKGKVIGLIGFSGGKIKKYCNTLVHIKTKDGDYGPVEDLQLIINHILAHWFQVKLKK